MRVSDILRDGMRRDDTVSESTVVDQEGQWLKSYTHVTTYIISGYVIGLKSPMGWNRLVFGYPTTRRSICSYLTGLLRHRETERLVIPVL